MSFEEHKKGIIVKHYSGSHAYGMSTPQSDVDFRGIFIASPKYTCTPFYNVREIVDKSEEDTKFFELNNFIELYTQANPNILESLWIDKKDIVFSTEKYWDLRQHRKELLSKKVAFTYTGYAHNQATRMSNHHSWMDKEQHAIAELQNIISSHPYFSTEEWIKDTFPEYITKHLVLPTLTLGITNYEKFLKNHSLQLCTSLPMKQKYFMKLIHNYMPQQLLDRDFDINAFEVGHQLIPYGDNIFGVIENDNCSLFNSDGSLYINTSSQNVELQKRTPKIIVKFNKEEYSKSADNRNSYHTWKKNRNVKRSVLEQEFGFDTKHGSHVVRLLRTAEEILTTGEVVVHRPDAKELLEIRNGAWDYKQMIQYWEYKDQYIREVLYPNCTILKKSPDIQKAASIILELTKK